MSEPILIWGAGAIGGTLGAYWARAGQDVLLVDQEAAHVAAMNAGGLRIEGPVETFTQPVRALTPDQVTGSYGRIVLAVKAHHTGQAMRQLLPHLAADGYVLSAQNGLNELEIAAIAGAARTMGCFVNFGADWHGPGLVMYGNRGAVVVGEIDGEVRQRTREMHELLRLFEPDAVLTGDIWGYLWGKLGYGAILFGTALSMASMAEAIGSPRHYGAWKALGAEVMRVARAKGVKPRGFNGFDPDAFADGAPEAATAASIAAMVDFNSKTAKTHSGIWRDLAVRRRKTEIDAQIAIIARIGREVGVATPTIDRLVTLIHDIEEGRRPQSWETLDLLVP